MSFFNVLDVAATGLNAQRIRINVIAANMANAKTTRTEEGGPYTKKNVIFEQVLRDKHKGGVRVQRIIPDTKPAMLVYEPGHPDANEEGYVAYPNINPVEEMVNMLEASRTYEANVTIINTAKQMAQAAISIGNR
jgi:flagellar basal-body rod protein FlgC